MGLFYLFSGIGSFIGTTIIASLSSSNIWFHSLDYGNINCRLPCTRSHPHVEHSCHLDYFFFLLAGIEVLGAFLFLLVARVFQLDEHHRHSRNLHQLAETSGDFMESTDTHRRNGHGQRHSIQRYHSDEASS